jgi:16S rRNA (cytidine1402-2'-O)-methyltransferase
VVTVLYVCATPIGNLGDVSPRVLDALREAELVAAEDTRRTRKLLSHFDIHTPLTSFFQHNELQKTDEVLRLLRDGRTVALVTDAGMPGVQDPGMLLVQKVVGEGLDMTVLPGPSAVLTALVASGISGDGFRFVGYLPRRARELEHAIDEWRRCGGLVVAFDTGQRLPRSLACLAAHLPEARGAVCRELTKVHEEVVRGTLLELSDRFPVPHAVAGPTASVRGEISVVLDLGRPLDAAAALRPDAAAAAEKLLGRGLSRRDAANALYVCLGLPRREADQLVREVAARVG